MSEDRFTSSCSPSSEGGCASDRPAELAERLRLGRLAKLQTLARQASADYVPVQTVGDAAWSILLAIYAAYAEQHVLNVTSLANQSGVPLSTGIRWIDALAERGLVLREPVQNDRRSFKVHLTDAGVLAMENLLRRHLRIFADVDTA